MSSPIPAVLAAENGPWAQVRTGTVAEASATSVFVLVGGTTIEAAFLTSYTPAAGHLVALLRQDSTWLCLGQIAGSGQNLVLNPGFEQSEPGSQPASWFVADLVGVAEAVAVASPDAPEGAQYAQVISDSASSSSYLYSNAISVASGDVLNVSAFVMGIYPSDVAQDADAALVALWFASTTDLYPTTSSPDIVVATLNDVPSGPPFSQISGQVTAPVEGFLRLALRSNLTAPASLAWDLASVRRVG